MALAAQDMPDLVTGTLKKLGKGRFNQIATRLQNYEVMQRVMKKDRVQFEDGIGIQRTVMIDHSGSAQQVGLFDTDVVNVADQLQTLDIPWRHTKAHFAIEHREVLMNRGESRIVSLVKTRRADAMISLVEHMETMFWNKPSDSNNKLDVYGVPYWLVKNATQGFNGGDPTGFASGAGNISTANVPRWANWTDTYGAVSKADLIRKLRKAHRRIKFKSPVNVPDFREGKGEQYRLYMGEETLASLEDIGESNNENLGRDLAPMDDAMAFKRNPLIWVPYLDADTTYPIFMLNFAWFHPVFLSGDYLRETTIMAPFSHNVTVTFFDCTWNVLCSNRREQAVLYKV